MLEISGLRVEIAGSPILRGVSLSVGPGELVCLLGRNGAGKTTTMDAAMGRRRASAGSVRLRGEELLGLPSHAIARMGVGFSPEESEVFAELTVAENIALPTWTRPEGRPATPARSRSTPSCCCWTSPSRGYRPWSSRRSPAASAPSAPRAAPC